LKLSQLQFGDPKGSEINHHLPLIQTLISHDFAIPYAKEITTNKIKIYKYYIIGIINKFINK
jgi:hypothetical protein